MREKDVSRPHDHPGAPDRSFPGDRRRVWGAIVCRFEGTCHALFLQQTQAGWVGVQVAASFRSNMVYS